MAPMPPGSIHAGLLKKKSPKGFFGAHWQKRCGAHRVRRAHRQRRHARSFGR